MHACEIPYTKHAIINFVFNHLRDIIWKKVFQILASILHFPPNQIAEIFQAEV